MCVCVWGGGGGMKTRLSSMTQDLCIPTWSQVHERRLNDNEVKTQL